MSSTLLDFETSGQFVDGHGLVHHVNRQAVIDKSIRARCGQRFFVNETVALDAPVTCLTCASEMTLGWYVFETPGVSVVNVRSVSKLNLV